MKRLLEMWRRRELALSLLEEYDYEASRPSMSHGEAVQRLEAYADWLVRFDTPRRTWSEVVREKSELYPR